MKISSESLVNESRIDALAKVSIRWSLSKTKLAFSCRKYSRPRNLTLNRLKTHTLLILEKYPKAVSLNIFLNPSELY